VWKPVVRFLELGEAEGKEETRCALSSRALSRWSANGSPFCLVDVGSWRQHTGKNSCLGQAGRIFLRNQNVSEANQYIAHPKLIERRELFLKCSVAGRR